MEKSPACFWIWTESNGSHSHPKTLWIFISPLLGSFNFFLEKPRVLLVCGPPISSQHSSNCIQYSCCINSCMHKVRHMQVKELTDVHLNEHSNTRQIKPMASNHLWMPIPFYPRTPKSKHIQDTWLTFHTYTRQQRRKEDFLLHC